MPDPSQGVCAVVLCAGQGSRYRSHQNQDKLLASCYAHTDSPPILAATLAALSGVAERTVVMVRDDNRQLLKWLDAQAAKLNVEVCAVQSTGLGHSLAQAVERFPARRGWLVALGDMPYVKSATLARIAAQINESNLVVPTYAGRRGHPRGIGTAHWAALLELSGDSGAQVLFNSADDIVELALDDPGVLLDVDTPQDRLHRPGDTTSG